MKTRIEPLAYFRAPIAIGMNAVKVLDGRQVLEGYAVISRGEALGHGLWIDPTMLQQVVDAGNAEASGVKARFTHPGLCSDGLGKFLGRAKNFRLDGDMVRADLHLDPISDKSPDGKLGSYVAELAQSDPAAFGTSIVFGRDFQAEKKFVVDGGGEFFIDEWGNEWFENFESPDPLNTENLRHARLADLHSSDVVDEPAANAGGFFSVADEIPARAEALLTYCMGLSQTAPDAFATGGMEPQRVKSFFDSFLQRHDLQISRRGSVPGSLGGQQMSDQKPAVTPAAPPEAKPKEAKKSRFEVREEALAEGRENGIAEAHARLAKLSETYPDKPAFVLEQYTKGASDAEIATAFNALQIDELKAENKRLREGGAPKPAGAPAATFSGELSPVPQKDFLSTAKDYATLHKVSLSDAMLAVAKDNPELHNEHLRKAQEFAQKRMTPGASAAK